MMDDLISRRDAINAVSEITTTMSVCTNKDECYGMKRMQKQAITELANLPSAEPEAPDINVGNMDDCISRKAAIDCLNNVSFDCSMDQEVVEEELLKLPPVHPTISKTENVDGAISRQATYLALVEKGQASKRYKLGETWELNGEEIREVLDALPSIQPERKKPVFKTGESFYHVSYADGTGGFEKNKWADWTCPDCGWFVGEQYIPRRHNQHKCNYCAKCGCAIDWSDADMRGEVNGQK